MAPRQRRLRFLQPARTFISRYGSSRWGDILNKAAEVDIDFPKVGLLSATS